MKKVILILMTIMIAAIAANARGIDRKFECIARKGGHQMALILYGNGTWYFEDIWRDSKGHRHERFKTKTEAESSFEILYSKTGKKWTRDYEADHYDTGHLIVHNAKQFNVMYDCHPVKKFKF